MHQLRRRDRVKHMKKTVPVIAAIFLVSVLYILSGQENRPVSPAGSASTAGSSSTAGSGSLSIVESDPGSIPDYSGEDYIVLNNGLPCFDQWDLENITGEHYSDLDGLGRCGCAYALLDRSMMPTQKREDIEHIKPSGWKQRKYEGLVDADPPFLYNRSHLIARALAGEEANEKNLITGTRYMNATTMLYWEEKVMRYIEDTNNHVLYRITPYFKDDELLARGVEMEAYSVEDDGRLCYHVFVYNIQPGIRLDYRTGYNERER